MIIDTLTATEFSYLSQRCGLRKRGRRYQQQGDKNHGATDDQQDFTQHIRVHQIFPVHWRPPSSRDDHGPAVASRLLLIVAGIASEDRFIEQVSRLLSPITALSRHR